MMIPVGPYRPDMAETNAGVSRRVLNVNPRRDGSGVSYHPRASLQAVGTALPDNPRGALAVVSREGRFKGYVGTEGAVYELQSDYTFDAIGAGYSLPITHDWGLTQYGDKLLYSNIFDGMFAYDIELGGASVPVAAAPNARFLFVAFECVFALDCDGNNYLMRNSAIGNYTNWTTGGAGAQEFPDGEALMGGGTLNDGTAAVLQRAAVHLLTVTGDARVYNRTKVVDGIGAVSPRCIVQTPGALYFIDVSGFYRLSTAGLEGIGQHKVNSTFLAALGAEGLQTVEGAYDPQRRQVCWRYRTNAVGSEIIFENQIIYDINTDEFVEAEESTAGLMRMSAPALSLEDLDAFGNLDELPYSLDSDVWKGGRPRLAAIDEDLRFGFFDGPALAAQVETATLMNLKSARVISSMPITDSPDVMVSIGGRNRLADAPVFKSPAPIQASGRAKTSARGKALNARMTIPAGASWSYLRGLDDLLLAEGGGR